MEARAKINLTLDVINRREDGYHNVMMIMQQVCLSDTVQLVSGSGDGPVTIECSHPQVPSGGANIACRAAQLIREHFNIRRGIEIRIDKNIPVAAGLAGGSTDAAAVIKGLNLLWELNMDMREMMNLGKVLGADVPFCIMGGTALAEGMGDILTPVRAPAELDLLLVKPDAAVSTAWAYCNLDPAAIHERPDSPMMIKALEAGDRPGIAGGLCNVFETVIPVHYPEIRDIKETMLRTGALGSVMTGSGPAVVGIYESREGAEKAAGCFAGRYRDVFVTRTFAG